MQSRPEIIILLSYFGNFAFGYKVRRKTAFRLRLALQSAVSTRAVSRWSEPGTYEESA